MRKLYYILLLVLIVLFLASCSSSNERKWDFPEAHSNPKVCEQYHPGTQDLCYSEVASFRHEPVICELINNSDWKDDCYFNIATDFGGVANGAQNITLCENIQRKFNRESCYYTIAQNTNPRK